MPDGMAPSAMHLTESSQSDSVLSGTTSALLSSLWHGTIGMTLFERHSQSGHRNSPCNRNRRRQIAAEMSSVVMDFRDWAADAHLGNVEADVSPVTDGSSAFFRLHEVVESSPAVPVHNVAARRDVGSSAKIGWRQAHRQGSALQHTVEQRPAINGRHRKGSLRRRYSSAE